MQRYRHATIQPCRQADTETSVHVLCTRQAKPPSYLYRTVLLDDDPQVFVSWFGYGSRWVMDHIFSAETCILGWASYMVLTYMVLTISMFFHIVLHMFAPTQFTYQRFLGTSMTTSSCPCTTQQLGIVFRVSLGQLVE